MSGPAMKKQYDRPATQRVARVDLLQGTVVGGERTLLSGHVDRIVRAIRCLGILKGTHFHPWSRHSVSTRFSSANQGLRSVDKSRAPTHVPPQQNTFTRQPCTSVQPPITLCPKGVLAQKLAKIAGLTKSFQKLPAR